jgi:CubicO group peptidase (beta-lactamase class C family)
VSALSGEIECALSRAVALGEVGVQVAAYWHDELIVDACIGLADEQHTLKVTGDTLFPVFSVSKAFVATMVHVFAERGLLDVDNSIAQYWPEFGCNGKTGITIRHVLQHRAGVPQAPPWLSPERLEWDEVVAWLAGTRPMAAPGERSQYHSLSFGYLLGEVLRRVDPAHRSFQELLDEEVCSPLGIRDVFFGLPENQELRVATLTWGADPPEAPEVAPNPIRDVMMPLAMAPAPATWNLRELHASANPAVSGIMTARDGARFMALLANRGALGGKRFLSASRLLDLTAPRPCPSEVDEGIGMPTSNGVGGFWVGGQHPVRHPVIGSGEHVLGHAGAGGAVAWADLDTNVSVMINHNRMFGSMPDTAHPFVEIARAVRRFTVGVR